MTVFRTRNILLPSQLPEPRWAWWTPCHGCGARRRGRATRRLRPSWESPCKGLAGSSERNRTSVRHTAHSFEVPHEASSLMTFYRLLKVCFCYFVHNWQHWDKVQRKISASKLISQIINRAAWLKGKMISVCRGAIFYTDTELYVTDELLMRLFQASLWLMRGRPCMSWGRWKTLWTWRSSRTSSIRCRTSMTKTWRRFRYELIFTQEGWKCR